MLRAELYGFPTWQERFPKRVRLAEIEQSPYWDMALGRYFADDIKKLDEALTPIVAKGTVIYPSPDLVFRALDKAPDRTSVLIVGQDPYHGSYLVNDKQVPLATGLCFSTPVGVPTPSSLRNIYSNGVKYGTLKEKPNHGELSFWSYQGCGMFNTSLTVEAGKANSHSKLWPVFTDKLFKYVAKEMDPGVVVMWGGSALKKWPLLSTDKHSVVASSHPSGLSAYKGVSYTDKASKITNTYPSFVSIDQLGIINSSLLFRDRLPISWKLL